MYTLNMCHIWGSPYDSLSTIRSDFWAQNQDQILGIAGYDIKHIILILKTKTKIQWKKVPGF